MISNLNTFTSLFKNLLRRSLFCKENHLRTIVNCLNHKNLNNFEKYSNKTIWVFFLELKCLDTKILKLLYPSTSVVYIQYFLIYWKNSTFSHHIIEAKKLILILNGIFPNSRTALRVWEILPYTWKSHVAHRLRNTVSYWQR